ITREAYEAVTENILNPYTQTYQSISKFKKTTYIDNTESQQVFIKVYYQVIQVSTGEVIAQNEVMVNKLDELHQAVFSGNPSNLFPTLPEGNYLPQVPEEWRNMFANNKRKLQDQQEFIQHGLKELASKLANELISKLPK
ncbi:MAG: hypothetical protein EAY81_07720, partial [Bacteroidetes bacterium]